MLLFIVSVANSQEFSATDRPVFHIHMENSDDKLRLENLTLPANGITVASNRMLFENLSFKLQFHYTTYNRSTLYMDKGNDLCVIDRIKTKERSEKYIFSKPVNLFLSRRLYQNIRLNPLKKSASRAIDLVDFFQQNPDQSLILSRQISYGVKLDKIIAQIPNSNKVYRDGAAYDTGVIHMFDRERANYALFYPQTLFEYDLKIAARSYEIKDIPPYVVGHLMCTNSAKMRKFVKEVDKVLNQLYLTDELMNLHLQYLQPGSSEIFKPYFREVTQQSLAQSDTQVPSPFMQ